MGVCAVVSHKSPYEQWPEIADHRETFEALCLSFGDVRDLYHLFEHMDDDRSGEIDVEELVKFLKVGGVSMNFMRRVFKTLDEDGDGSIDFREFVVSMWNYCTIGKASLAIFAFDLYDSNMNGTIEISEIRQMLKDIYGDNFMGNKSAKMMLDEIKKDIDGCRRDEHLTPFDFSEITDQYPGCLAPTAQFQNELQDKVMGKKFWDRIAKRKIVLQNKEEINVGQLHQAHMNNHARTKVHRYKTDQIAHFMQNTGTRFWRLQRRGARHELEKQASLKTHEKQSAGERERAKKVREARKNKNDPNVPQSQTAGRIQKGQRSPGKQKGATKNMAKVKKREVRAMG